MHPIEKLIQVMAKLRDPNGGCPWDLEQDFKSIAPYTIEEAYEVADAISRGDFKDLREELGDLLLQPIYHAQMAAEAGHFDIQDVIKDVTEKMISRHPHVFGDQKAAKAEDVNKIWDERKAQEKASAGALDGVARGLPALMRAQKLQKKAAKTGFEWKKTEQVLAKLNEELLELNQAMENGTEADKAEEFGDVLFVLVNFARLNGIDAESALRSCNDKFYNRFNKMEEYFKSINKEMKSATVPEMQDVWNRQKQNKNS